MATGGNRESQMAKTFKNYVEATSVGQTLSEAAKKEIKDKGLNKMLKECCGAAVAKAAEAQVFPKYCDKKTKKLHVSVFTKDFMDELAATVIQNKKSLTRRPDVTDEEVMKLADELRDQIALHAEDKKKEAKVDAVTSRLTDTKGYTGSHKERFDESGKGKGAAGREDQHDGSGYVTGYKNKDTYDKKPEK